MDELSPERIGGRILADVPGCLDGLQGFKSSGVEVGHYLGNGSVDLLHVGVAGERQNHVADLVHLEEMRLDVRDERFNQWLSCLRLKA